ncbi:energy transducer TonB [Flavobacterium succinicans]|uniref:Gram-negative bacterial tonB protein n=1 Tax=Flavobacterium succinicans TaxID=29536 RepID=A0A199XRS9_9FLAO|nr:energy transducer TonB [Flavobacterium succinicans]OAZ04034.1 gram-negative bacterial tonB protein [Flavobacterium succinicans]
MKTSQFPLKKKPTRWFRSTMLVLALIVNSFTNAQENPSQKKETGTLYQNYFNNTVFKIKNEKGDIVAEKKYTQLNQAEKKLVPSFLGGSKTMPTKEELDQILQKGGPAVIIIDAFDPKNKKTKKGENVVYQVNEITEDPIFPNGMEAFYKYVAMHFTLPKEAVEQKAKGKIYLSFIIETDGSLTEITTLRDNVGYGTVDEAIRVVKSAPKWIPGKINSEPVRVKYSLPITINPKA